MSPSSSAIGAKTACMWLRPGRSTPISADFGGLRMDCLVWKFYRTAMNRFNAQDSTSSSLIEGAQCRSSMLHINMDDLPWLRVQTRDKAQKRRWLFLIRTRCILSARMPHEALRHGVRISMEAILACHSDQFRLKLPGTSYVIVHTNLPPSLHAVQSFCRSSWMTSQNGFH